MAENLGTAEGKIKIDSSEAERSLSNFDKKASQSTGGLTAVSGALAGVGAAGVGAFALAVKSAADFEKQLSGIKAVSGATEKDMEALRKKALELGADTSFSADEAALAMEELVKAGLNVDDVLNGAADSAVYLAAAGEIDLPQAASIAANAMNQFGLSAEQMPRIADLIAGAANASAIDVSDFGMSLSQAGAVANLVGLDFDDLALAVTAMGNAGIKGSDAGTSLKTFLTGLHPTTEKQIDLFYDLGLAVEDQGTALNEMGNQFYDANGNIKSMTEIAGTLGTALEGMSQQQKVATLETLFGSDAIRAAAIIADTGAEGFDNLADSMGQITAKDVADTRLDNLSGSVEQFKGALETFMIEAGTPFLGMLRTVVDAGTGLVDKLNEMDPKFRTIGLSVAAAGAALALVAGSAGLFVHAAAPAARGALVLGKAIGSLTLATIKNTAAMLVNPWVLAAIAIAALVAGVIYAYRNFEGFREVVDAVVSKIVDLGKTIWKWIKGTGLPALKEFGEFFMDEIVPRIVEFGEAVVDVIGDIADWILNDAVPAIVDAWDLIADKAIEAWEWIDKNVISTVSALVALIVAILDKLIAFTSDVLIPAIISAWETLWPVIQFVFETVVSIIQTAMTIIQTVIQTIIDVIMIAWRLFGDNIISAIQIAFGFIKGIIETVLGIVRGIIQIVTALITGDWNLFLTGLRTIWDTIWNGIKTVVETIIKSVQLVIETAIDAIQLAIETALKVIKLAWDTAWEAMGLLIDTIWGAIQTAVETVINSVKGTIETTINTIKSLWENVWGGIKSFFTGVWDDIQSKVTGAVDAIKGAISGAWDTVSGYFTDTWGAISDGFSDVWEDIKGFVEDGIEAIFEFIGGIPDGVVGALGDGFSAIWEAFKGVINQIIRAWNALELPSFTIGGWDPPGPGPKFPSLTIGPIGVPNIPELAGGGVAFAPLFAMIGEYPGASRNPEIVAPQSIMRQTVLDAMRDLLGSRSLDEVISSAYDPAPPTRSSAEQQQTAREPGEGTRIGVAIEHATFMDSVDWQTIQQQSEFAMQATG